MRNIMSIRFLNQPRRSKGFTLVEILVVLVILGMLMGLVGPRLYKQVDSSKVKTAEAQVKMLKSVLLAYRLDVGDFPTTSQGLGALMKEPDKAEGWDGPYLDEELPLDPWKNEYVYKAPVDNLQGFVLYSRGSDGVEGGEGLGKDVGYLSE